MTIVGIVFVALLLLAVASLVAARVMLERRNRVVTGVRASTPLFWLASPGPEAHLHRRLRAAGRRLELLPATEGVAEIMGRLQVEIVELDGHLVTVSRRPSSVRRADRREAREQLGAIEDLVRRLEERSRDRGDTIPELAERLAMLEAADEELRGLDPGPG